VFQVVGLWSVRACCVLSRLLSENSRIGACSARRTFSTFFLGSRANIPHQLDSADAYDQPALLYRMSSAGMTKDHTLGHSTYDHIPPFIPPLYSTFQQLVPFFIYALVSTILTRASYYKLLTS
jgi:hypothetical protein